MRWLRIFSGLILISGISGSLYIPGHNCDCPQYICQPPTSRTCPMILCPMPRSCFGGGYGMNFGNPYTQQRPQYIQMTTQAPIAQRFHQPVIDELEMRAFASGLSLGQPTERTDSSQLRVLESLGDDLEMDKIVEEDLDLTQHGLRKADIRRSPQITVREVPEAEDPPAGVQKRETSEPVSTQSQSGIELPKCNSQVLKKLMEENMSDNSSDSKRKVNTAAEAKFGGNVDVVCSRGHFSYVFSSNLYCETTKGLVTCIAFRQAV